MMMTTMTTINHAEIDARIGVYPLYVRIGLHVGLYVYVCHALAADSMGLH